jgi:hypothetical protein
MKKTLLIMLMILTIISCKNEAKSEAEKPSEANEQMSENAKTKLQNDGLITVQGTFVYYDDAAVLQTPSGMIGVVVDEKMQDLNERVQAYKKESTDMVPVTIRGRLFKKPENEIGWENRIEIKEILKVSPPKAGDNEVIRLENKESK